MLAGRSPKSRRTQTPCGRELTYGIRVLPLPESAPVSMAPSSWALMPPSGEGGRGVVPPCAEDSSLRHPTARCLGRVSPAPPSQPPPTRCSRRLPTYPMLFPPATTPQPLCAVCCRLLLPFCPPSLRPSMVPRRLLHR